MFSSITETCVGSREGRRTPAPGGIGICSPAGICRNIRLLDAAQQHCKRQKQCNPTDNRAIAKTFLHRTPTKIPLGLPPDRLLFFIFLGEGTRLTTDAAILPSFKHGAERYHTPIHSCNDTTGLDLMLNCFGLSPGRGSAWLERLV